MKRLHAAGLRPISLFAAKVVFLCLCSMLLLPGCSPNMDSLIDDLGSPKAEVVQKAEDQLMARKDEAAPALKLALTNPSAAVRGNACLVLVKIESNGAAASIARLLADSDEAVRATAGKALAGMDEDAAKAVAANLKDFGASKNYLNEAAKLLTNLSATLGDKATAPLVTALKDPTAAVRLGTCKLLAAVEGGKAAGDITALLADEDASVTSGALSSLQQMGDAAIECYARQYAANAGSGAYVAAANPLLGANTDKSINILLDLYRSDATLKETLLALFAAVGDPAYERFADGYLNPGTSAALKDEDLQILQGMGTPAGEWLAPYYGKGASPADRAERLKLVVLASGAEGSDCSAVAARLFAEKDADTDVLALYGASDDAFKAKIVSFLTRAGEASSKRFIPYADAAKYPALAPAVIQIYSGIGKDAVRILLDGSYDEKLRDGILKRMDQAVVKEGLFGLVDVPSFSDSAVKCIRRIGNPSYSTEIIAYAKKNETNKANFDKAMQMIDASRPSDDIISYLAKLRDKSGEVSWSARNMLVSFAGCVPASRYKASLAYTAKGRGTGKIGRVVVLEYLYNGYYNETPELIVSDDTFSEIPIKHMLSSKAFGAADNAILVRERIVPIGIWYEVSAPSVHYKAYRIDTDISLIDLKKHQVIYKKTVAVSKSDYYFNHYKYKGSNVLLVDPDYGSVDITVDEIIRKYLR